MKPHLLHRRTVLIGAATLPLSARAAMAVGPLPKMTVTRDPTCGCCGAWVEHVRAAGFPVEVVDTTELNGVKVRLGVPQPLAACHTAEVGGYVVEGHVPAEAVKRLLAERPEGKGLAVAGMPMGSPGMEVAGAEPQTYDVVLFGDDGQRSTFARYRGLRPV